MDALARDPNGGAARTLTQDQLEVAVLDRSRWQQRKFKRLVGAQLGRLLAGDETATGDVEDSDVPDDVPGDVDVPEPQEAQPPAGDEG